MPVDVLGTLNEASIRNEASILIKLAFLCYLQLCLDDVLRVRDEPTCEASNTTRDKTAQHAQVGNIALFNVGGPCPFSDVIAAELAGVARDLTENSCDQPFEKAINPLFGSYPLYAVH